MNKGFLYYVSTTWWKFYGFYNCAKITDERRQNRVTIQIFLLTIDWKLLNLSFTIFGEGAWSVGLATYRRLKTFRIDQRPQRILTFLSGGLWYFRESTVILIVGTAIFRECGLGGWGVGILRSVFASCENSLKFLQYCVQRVCHFKLLLCSGWLSNVQKLITHEHIHCSARSCWPWRRGLVKVLIVDKC